MARTRIHLAALALILVTGIANAGEPAPATGAYPFALSPDKAFEKLAALDPASGRKLALTREEAHLFADARDGTLDGVSFADACLIASGVTDREKRRAYKDKLDEIEAAARKAVEGTTTGPEAAERLLKFLHAGPMAKGYEAHQTDLHTVLDTGRFNCVSSAALYNVIGRRLGLELRAVEIPEHVFSVLCDGDKRIDIETTNARGFDPAGADRSAEERHAGHRREVGELGLAAIVAYNHGVGLSSAKRFQEAALANVRALALDPTNPGAARNAAADLTSWPVELAKAGEYETALAVLVVGLELAPTDSTLQNNRKALYDVWADGYVKRGDWAGAVRVYERGLAQLPGDEHLANNLAYCREQTKK